MGYVWWQEEEVQQQLQKLTPKEVDDFWENLGPTPDTDDQGNYSQTAEVTVNVLPGKPEDVPAKLFDENRRQVTLINAPLLTLQRKSNLIYFDVCTKIACISKTCIAINLQAGEIADLQADIVSLEEQLEALEVLCEVKEEDKAVSTRHRHSYVYTYM